MGLIAEATEYKKRQAARPSLSFLAGWAAGRAFMGLLGVLVSMRITVCWLIALGFFVWAMDGWGGALFVAVLALGFWSWGPARRWRFWGADRDRWLKERSAARAVEAGNEWLRSCRLVSASDEGMYDCTLVDEGERVVVTLGTAVAGLPSSKVVDAARDYRDRFDAETVSVSELGAGALEIRYMRVNPLDEVKEIQTPAALDPASMSVVCAVGEDGEPVSLSFREVSGMCVSGLAGSGKTAGVSTFLVPLALSPDVELTIIDCKGGTDWAAFSEKADRYMPMGSGLDDLREVHSLLVSMRDEMEERLRTQKSVLGVSNFWNAPIEKRQAAGLRFKMLVIDEAQEVFATPIGADKEAKQLAAECAALITTLVKRGRSAGVHVMVITQKMTTDSVPSAVRDNCARRLSFRLMTAEAEKAVMGADASDLVGKPRPTEIPMNRKGGAVIVSDTGEMLGVRFFYMPEDVQERCLLGGGQDG